MALSGFPLPPIFDIGQLPINVFSAFRPYGRGRKAVRPVICRSTLTEEKILCKNRKPCKIAMDQGNPYKTEIFNIEQDEADNLFRFKVRLYRGFRHQIRCHLAWLGYPLLNDPLYGGKNTNQQLALFAQALMFKNPETGKPEEIRL
jgi:23S rRNA pseudouridine1911/1915/1917 synthase